MFNNATIIKGEFIWDSSIESRGKGSRGVSTAFGGPYLVGDSKDYMPISRAGAHKAGACALFQIGFG